MEKQTSVDSAASKQPGGESNAFICTECGDGFSQYPNVLTHIAVHGPLESFPLDGSSNGFEIPREYVLQENDYHLSLKVKSLGKSETNQEKKVEKTYPCKKCKLHFFWLSDFQTHSSYHCKGKEPGATFASENEVNSKKPEAAPHEKHINGTLIDVKNGDSKAPVKDNSTAIEDESSFTPYRCGLCGDRFQKLAALKEHHLTHQTQEEIDRLNQESEKTLKRKPGPKGRRGRRGNPSAKLHPCKHCHRVFNHSSSLSRHMRYHKGTMHTCVFCGRHFPQRCDVRRHIAMYHKLELEKKPGLKHMALHTSPQKNGSALNSFKEVKSKSSSDKQTELEEQHEKEEQTEKSASKSRVNYECEECGKRFGLLCVYQRHLRYHKKEPTESFKCLQCPAHFGDSSSLQHHLLNHPSTREADVVGHTTPTSGVNQDPVLKKDSAGDIEDDYMDHSQDGNGTSAEVLYECTECTETFSCLETFLQHQISHGSENSG
ncbi:uncharacterized protein ACN63O_002422 [Diretmus argenteus]